jgi:ABC-type tungstate transport system permease subunit
MHSRRNTTLAFIALFGATFFSAVQALAQEKSIVIASTTSTQDSGLFLLASNLSAKNWYRSESHCAGQRTGTRHW